MKPSISKDLKVLLEGVLDIPEISDISIEGLSLDSRKVKKGFLFLAFPGVQSDGREFIDDAITNGCAAVVIESYGDALSDEKAIKSCAAPIFYVNNLREKVSRIASNFYCPKGLPFKIVGITGTNGKTTCSHLIAHGLTELGKKCGLIGTLGAGIYGNLKAIDNTTPDAIEVFKTFKQFCDDGVEIVVMEVSSHGIQQGRVKDVPFDVAVFTNLSRDHLDYHESLDHYGAIKANLFEVPSLSDVIINIDDPFSSQIIKKIPSNTNVYGISVGPHMHTLQDSLGSLIFFEGDIVGRSSSGMTLSVSSDGDEYLVQSGLIGDLNACNILVAISVLRTLGCSLSESARALASAKPIPGRMEQIAAGSGAPLIVIDYAHTPDALDKASLAVRPYAQGNLYCVFGCGGDRDKGKRSQMGAIAETNCDHVILTDDNPRHESGGDIIQDIVSGMSGLEGVNIIPDRRDAIRTAISNARKGDVVLIAGKGHEDYQIIGDEKLYFSDFDVVQEFVGQP